MRFLELVTRRMSVREYSARPVPRDIITKCLEAARLAPSACNSQPWYFIVIDDKEMKDKLVDKAFSGVYSMNSFARNAPALVAVVRRMSKYIADLAGYFRDVQYNLIDIGIACEHFVLQAEEEGVGTCFLGWFNEKAVKKTLNLAKNEKVDIIISLGYPGNEVIKDKIRKPLGEISKFNY